MLIWMVIICGPLLSAYGAASELVKVSDQTEAELERWTKAQLQYKHASAVFKKAYRNSFNKTQQASALQKKSSAELQKAMEEFASVLRGYHLPDVQCQAFEYICARAHYSLVTKNFARLIKEHKSGGKQALQKAYDKYDQAFTKHFNIIQKAVEEKQQADAALKNFSKDLNAAMAEYKRASLACGFFSCRFKHSILHNIKDTLNHLADYGAHRSSSPPSQPPKAAP